MNDSYHDTLKVKSSQRNRAILGWLGSHPQVICLVSVDWSLSTRIPFLFPNQGTASEQEADPLVTTPSAGHSSPGRKEMTSPAARFVLWKSWESVTHSDRSQKSNDHLLKILFRSFKLKICANTNHHLLLTVRLGLINPQCMNISGGSQNNDISPSKRYIQN